MTAMTEQTNAYQVAASTPDPELPMLTIEDLGILRSVDHSPDEVTVTITPTYSGCPAMREITADIRSRLTRAGFPQVTVNFQLAPPWTTDWITPGAGEKLRAYGIAPPQGDRPAGAQPLRFMPRGRPAADQPPCPHCGSPHTERLAQFGSTACKALYRCLDCREPFDYFKPY